MAYRDKSQGFAFVYVDIKKLLQSKKTNPVEEKSEAADSKVINFNRDRDPVAGRMPSLPPKQFVPIQPSLVADKSMQQIRERAQAIEQIKRNLDRLQSLHHKLHAMLEDLNKVSELKKKKKRDE